MKLRKLKLKLSDLKSTLTSDYKLWVVTERMRWYKWWK